MWGSQAVDTSVASADVCKAACLQGETQSVVCSSSPGNLVPVCFEKAGVTDQAGAGNVGVAGGHDVSGQNARLNESRYNAKHNQFLLSGCQVMTTRSCSIIRSSTTSICGVICVSSLWWIPAPVGEQSCSAPIPTWKRRRFIVAIKRVFRTCPGLDPGRVSLPRRQAVYISECLSSSFTSQAAFSLQCQHECFDPGQTASASAKRWEPSRVFDGKCQTSRLQPTSPELDEG